ncbi:MAG: hypothetical protein QM805_07795 [Pseudomonas sp.]
MTLVCIKSELCRDFGFVKTQIFFDGSKNGKKTFSVVTRWRRNKHSIRFWVETQDIEPKIATKKKTMLIDGKIDIAVSDARCELLEELQIMSEMGVL